MLAATLEIVEAAGGRGIPLRLVGGLAVQALCPDFPPRTRDGQDLDLATTGQARTALTGHLEGEGFEPDRPSTRSTATSSCSSAPRHAG